MSDPAENDALYDVARKATDEVLGEGTYATLNAGNPDPGVQAAIARSVENDAPTRVVFDTEFIEDGRTIDLLSIGLVREDGATYYAEPAETDRSRASMWVQENVLPYLTGPVKPRAQIASEIRTFVGPRPEFWAWYADYDWVALCQLYGTMMDLPKGWPMFCRDYRQVTDGATLPKQDPELDGPEHHALSDARWLARVIPPEGGTVVSAVVPDPATGRMLVKHADGTTASLTPEEYAATRVLPPGDDRD